MRLAFINGRLEPNRDGVGDYVRTLANACARRGHEVALLSLAEPGAGSLQAAEPLRVLRLGGERSVEQRAKEARAWLQDFSPDWTSLHFVPYSFHPRGLFGAAIQMLDAVTRVAPRRHLFFHEIWIGGSRGASWRERLVGMGQKRAVRRLLAKVAPQVVHTSIGYNRAGLAAAGCKAGLLPMFGSVPMHGATKSFPEMPEIPRAAMVAGMFGALHPNWNAGAFLTDFTALAESQGRPAVLAAAGDLRYGAEFFAALKQRWAGQVAFVALGEQPAHRLEGIFARFDFAVTSVPWNLIGKSSSAAALREHGLPVVVTNAGASPRFPVTEGELEPSDSGFLPYFRDRDVLCGLRRTFPRSGVGAVVDRFLSDLGAEPSAGKDRP